MYVRSLCVLCLEYMTLYTCTCTVYMHSHELYMYVKLTLFGRVVAEWLLDCLLYRRDGNAGWCILLYKTLQVCMIGLLLPSLRIFGYVLIVYVLLTLYIIYTYMYIHVQLLLLHV